MKIKDWPVNARPREKLMRDGPESLSDAELLAILLRTGTKNKSAVDLAHYLIVSFGGLKQIVGLHQSRFCQEKGIGVAKYCQVMAALELAKRYLKETVDKANIFHHSDQIKNYIKAELRQEKQEIFMVLLLDNAYHMIALKKLFYGTINRAMIYPREIVRAALQHDASGIVFVHNHPSGNASPSKEDKYMTDKLHDLLENIDIDLVDHYIVGGETVFSFAEHGLL